MLARFLVVFLVSAVFLDSVLDSVVFLVLLVFFGGSRAITLQACSNNTRRLLLPICLATTNELACANCLEASTEMRSLTNGSHAPTLTKCRMTKAVEVC